MSRSFFSIFIGHPNPHTTIQARITTYPHIPLSFFAVGSGTQRPPIGLIRYQFHVIVYFIALLLLTKICEPFEATLILSLHTRGEKYGEWPQWFLFRSFVCILFDFTLYLKCWMRARLAGGIKAVKGASQRCSGQRLTVRGASWFPLSDVLGTHLPGTGKTWDISSFRMPSQ